MKETRSRRQHGFGRKVIVSRLEVFDEIGVPPEYQIDFDDPGQLRRALALPPTRLRKPTQTWAQVAAGTLDVLRKTKAAG